MSNFPFQANLFQVGKDRNKDYPGAPTLVPKGGDSYDVNVHGEYSWTVSDDARSYIPRVTLTEYKLEFASELNALQQMVGGSGQNVAIGAAALTRIPRVQALANAIAAIPGAGFLKSASDNIVATGADKIKNLVDEFFIGKDDMLDGVGNKEDESLNPYRNLYTTEKTGWGYVLPYLGAGNMTDITNTFSQSDFKTRFLTPWYKASQDLKDPKSEKNKTPGSILGSVFAASNSFVGGAAGAIRAENPQSFTGTSTENIKVVFYLLNTIKSEDIRKNYEFCYLLTYQNLPNRRSINVLDSPPLYRAKVDGYKTLPVCYMNDLKIENVGAVRLVDIGQTSVKNQASNSVLRGAESNSNTVKMIPEAYKISFTLQSVFMNSQNMFVFAANPEGIVTTSVATAAAAAVATAAAPTNLEQVNSTLGSRSVSPVLNTLNAEFAKNNPGFNQSTYRPIFQ